MQDLDKFSEKLDFGRKAHVRYVTPNIVMDVWNMHAAQEPVIGLAATLGTDSDAPLSESRIMTLSNRTWNDLHLADFDVAIELPDQLVSGGKCCFVCIDVSIHVKVMMGIDHIENRPPEMNPCGLQDITQLQNHIADLEIIDP